MQIYEYLKDNGDSPFSKWFSKVNSIAAAKITTSIIRMEQGNLSNCKSLGSGIWEYKIHFGPGYRIYFGKDGDKVVILLFGGSKRQQSKDIDLSKSYWQDYKKRKRITLWH